MFKYFLFMILLTASIRSYGQGLDTSSASIINTVAVAVKHNFPLPDQVLKFKQQLALTPLQLATLNAINKTLTLKKTETTISNNRNEHMLDSMFRTGRLNEGSIIFYTNRYGLYQGELRGALLIACYNTRQALTAAQLAKLKQLQNHN